MEISFYPTIEQTDRDGLTGALVVIIDVLRSGSTVIAALESGATRIIPVEGLETALRVARASDRASHVLAGERGGRMIEGFDLGNSPPAFTPAAVGGTTVILTTTNGTRAVAAAAKADRMLICAINNCGAVARAVRGATRLAILCCGTEGRLSAEDVLCGGMLLDELGDRLGAAPPEDAARLARLLAREVGGRVEEFLLSCENGRSLAAMGLAADVVHCARRDSSRLVPEVKGGTIHGC
jgi:2-phosphosulfolactate phosphatase